MLYKVGKELHFPVTGENSWDAFNDWLGFIYEPYDKYSAVKMIFKNCAGLKEDVKKTFFEILGHIAEEGFLIVENDLDRQIPCYYEVLD